ncbi:hypothetical protein K438DRAFT_1755432 [Mycena galopus ATCC 62051]|nr:hypothetical protein K438DRAFT_1755432 [Mycena galopus ATCC 62051]
MVQLMEPIHQIVYGIFNLHINSETVGCLPPSMLDNIGTFMGTLHKIYTYIETQQEGRKIKNLFRSSEIKQLLQDCHAGLNQAIKVFITKTGAGIFNDVREFKNKAELMHKELIKLIETLSDTSTISERSSILGVFNESKNSSNSFSMLLAKPKIFHGRDQELEDVLNLLSEKSPRIAILGGGGMGKTTLARAALHHPDIASKFEHRFFVSAEAATTSIELAALMGLQLGLDPGQDLTKAAVRYLARTPASLLILDNLETVWEDIQTRAGIENLLSLLRPLQPLSNGAATQTFIDITDSAYSVDEVDQLLQFTGNMPLAVDLIAHLTDYEGLSNVLLRWESEKMSMLSVGTDRRSSLDTSIGLSLSSPRITTGSNQIGNCLMHTSELPISLAAKLLTVYGHTPLMNDIQGLLPELCDHQLEICFLLEVLHSQQYWPLVTQEALAEARGHLGHINDPVLQARFYRAVGVYFLHHKGDSQGATDFLQHALKLSERCGDINEQCSVLSAISPLQNVIGRHAAAQDHASLGQKLAKLSGNLYEEAQANSVGAKCSIAMGKYQESAEQLERARELLRICGMSGGALDRGITMSQAEIHLLKSEYAQCRSIHSDLVENTSSQENSLFYATALLNIATIDIIIGVASQEVYHNLRRGREIFRNENYTKPTLHV